MNVKKIIPIDLSINDDEERYMPIYKIDQNVKFLIYDTGDGQIYISSDINNQSSNDKTSTFSISKTSLVLSSPNFRIR